MNPPSSSRLQENHMNGYKPYTISYQLYCLILCRNRYVRFIDGGQTFPSKGWLPHFLTNHVNSYFRNLVRHKALGLTQPRQGSLVTLWLCDVQTNSPHRVHEGSHTRLPHEGIATRFSKTAYSVMFHQTVTNVALLWSFLSLAVM